MHLSIHADKPADSTTSNTSTVIGASLGCFGLLLICLVLVATIIIIRWKGSKQRNFAVSERNTGTYQDCQLQGEYSTLQYSVQWQRSTDRILMDTQSDDTGDMYSQVRLPAAENKQEQSDLQGVYSLAQGVNPDVDADVEESHSKGQYSLLHAEVDVENESEAQTSTSKGKHGIVYADVVPLKKNEDETSSSKAMLLSEDLVEYAQINPSSFNPPSPEPTSGHPIDHTLNLDTVLVQIQSSLKDRWRDLGQGLGIPEGVLDRCHQYSAEQRLVEVVDFWLRNHVGQPTWLELGHVIKSIGIEDLGSSLVRSYDTGHLPLEVDMTTVNLLQFEEEEAPPLPPRQS